MTLSERNLFFKTGFFFCAAVILLTILASFWAVPVYSAGFAVIDENTRQPDYFFQHISGLFIGNNYYAVHISLSLAVLFSFAGILLIYIFFERTPAPEILYISFFIVSFAFEALRLVIPLQLLINFPSIYLGYISRFLLFARFFSIFSLFTAGLCVAGLEMRKTRIAVLIITIAALVITIGVPVDVHSWDTGFNLINGYSTMFRMIELMVFVTTTLSFFIASKSRGLKEYAHAAIGVILVMAGRNILLGTDNWLGPLPGIFLLVFGTWYICSKVHKIHLWL